MSVLQCEYYRARAEEFRLLMLTTLDPAVATRLRGFVQEYRALAEGAQEKIESPPLYAAETDQALIKRLSA
jgi:hypothetical protein